MRTGFFLSTASSFCPTWNVLDLGVVGDFLKQEEGATVASFIVLAKNFGHEVALRVKPIGGCNIGNSKKLGGFWGRRDYFIDRDYLQHSSVVLAVSYLVQLIGVNQFPKVTLVVRSVKT